MSQLVDVIFAYTPKNDDELELKVGDKIEVFESVEEGWWRGKLRGRLGVFPSNFVKLADTNSILASANNSIASQQNRLGLFGGKSSKTSLSSNSLNSNNSNSYNNNNNGHNIFNNNPINNISVMNNTQNQDSTTGLEADQTGITSSERKPKPVRGVGFGDIFANATAAGKSKPLPANPIGNGGIGGGVATERLSTINANNLQKQIPKKPPPPTPTSDNSNGVSAQAPALPPKPANQFSPHLQHSRPLPALHQVSTMQQQQHQSLPQPPSSHQSTMPKREQARVIYAYEPVNDDELAMEVGDIINVLDKNIEDAGWWRGEHRGKIGVFPDNFVQLIEVPATTDQWANNRSSTSSQPSFPPQSSQYNSEVGKLKSVFAGTPKGFSKELENNLEKHNNSAASFLSLKRNKLQQHQMANVESTMNEDSKPESETLSGSVDANSPTKLNHITANRAKGPTRRPPSNLLGKRNQIDNSSKRTEPNGREEGLTKSLLSSPSTTTSSLVTSSTTTTSSMQHQQPINNEPLSSLPNSTNHQTTSVIGSFPPKSIDGISANNSIKSSASLDNVIDESSQAPKTSQRSNQINASQDKSKTAVTPPWMVELRKAQTERKRETPLGSVGSANDEDNSPTKVNDLPSGKGVEMTNNVIPASMIESSVSNHQISKNVTNELSEIKEELKRMRSEMVDMKELKETIEVMKIELKACQSATENQKRYIKDLVNNLADERKKIAAMQTELERNLK